MGRALSSSWPSDPLAGDGDVELLTDAGHKVGVEALLVCGGPRTQERRGGSPADLKKMKIGGRDGDFFFRLS
jgi:hypothetical protein